MVRVLSGDAPFEAALLDIGISAGGERTCVASVGGGTDVSVRGMESSLGTVGASRGGADVSLGAVDSCAADADVLLGVVDASAERADVSLARVVDASFGAVTASPGAGAGSDS